jgi:hypothetical protein
MSTNISAMARTQLQWCRSTRPCTPGAELITAIFSAAHFVLCRCWAVGAESGGLSPPNQKSEASLSLSTPPARPLDFLVNTFCPSFLVHVPTVPSTRGFVSASQLSSHPLTLTERSLHAFCSFLGLQMDANAPVKRQSPECSASVPSLYNLDALPDDWKTFPWNKFPGSLISDRVGRQTPWVWQHGFDIQARDSPTKRKWVCKHCLRKANPR